MKKAAALLLTLLLGFSVHARADDLEPSVSAFRTQAFSVRQSIRKHRTALKNLRRSAAIAATTAVILGLSLVCTKGDQYNWHVSCQYASTEVAQTIDAEQKSRHALELAENRADVAEIQAAIAQAAESSDKMDAIYQAHYNGQAGGGYACGATISGAYIDQTQDGYYGRNSNDVENVRIPHIEAGVSALKDFESAATPQQAQKALEAAKRALADSDLAALREDSANINAEHWERQTPLDSLLNRDKSAIDPSPAPSARP